MDPKERAIDKLEEDLCDPDLTDEDRRLIRQDIREIQKDIADEERWREEGYERGWR